MADDTRTLTGLFPDRASAERAWQGASSRGYGQQDISLVMSDETRERHFGPGGLGSTNGTDAAANGTQGDRPTELGNKAAEGAGIGAGVGGALGAIAGVIAAVGTTIALPGLGLVIAGPLAAGLAGAGAGGAAGGLVGALVGWNIPEERIKAYESGIRGGGIVMGLRARSDEDMDHLERDWRDANGTEIHR